MTAAKESPRPVREASSDPSSPSSPSSPPTDFLRFVIAFWLPIFFHKSSRLPPPGWFQWARKIKGNMFKEMKNHETEMNEKDLSRKTANPLKAKTVVLNIKIKQKNRKIKIFI